jgi:hypothetical protein
MTHCIEEAIVCLENLKEAQQGEDSKQLQGKSLGLSCFRSGI